MGFRCGRGSGLGRGIQNRGRLPISKRLATVSARLFTTFCFVVLEESEQQDDVFSDEQLFDIALLAAKDDPTVAEALCERFRGFIEMSFHPDAAPYVYNHANQMKFHPALFEAAATARSRKNGSFPDKPFFRRVSELASEKYADFEFDDVSSDEGT